MQLKSCGIFIFAGLVGGIIILFVTPPFQVPDEFNHFFRAFQVSEGRIFSEKHDDRLGGFLPKSLPRTMSAYRHLPFHPENKLQVKDIAAFLDLPLDEHEREFCDFPNTALYSPIPYLPQSLGLIAGRLFHASPLMLLYLGRLTNLIVWAVLIYIAIRTTPIFKWVFCLLALMPTSLFLAASLSADCFTNALAFLTTAVFLRCAFDKQRLGGTHLDIILLFILTLSLSLSKNSYLPIVVLYLLIPSEKVGSLKKYCFIFAALVSINILVMMGWSLSIKGLYITYDSYNNSYRSMQPLVDGANPYKQFEFIVSNFFWYLYIIIKSFWIGREYLANSFIGYLGWIDTFMPRFYILSSALVLLFFSIFETNRPIKFNLGHRLILLLSISCTIFLFSTLIYTIWTPVGSDLFSNLQGRYFIPISPVFFLVFYNRRFHLKDNYLIVGGSIYVFVSLILEIIVLLRRYYLL